MELNINIPVPIIFIKITKNDFLLNFKKLHKI
jgi:hypothetical protein